MLPSDTENNQNKFIHQMVTSDGTKEQVKIKTAGNIANRF